MRVKCTQKWNAMHANGSQCELFSLLQYARSFALILSSSSGWSMNQNKINAQRIFCQREVSVYSSAFFNRIFHSVGIKLNPISCSFNGNVKCIESGA